MNDLSVRLAKLSPAKRALFQSRLAESQGLRVPIAVVGLACRFPGAHDPEAFWRLLRDGGDAITEVPPERWDVEEFYDPTPVTPGKMNTRWGGFLEQVSHFDAHFFGISPREAVSLDPQQRLLLEVAWEALEDAGVAPKGLAGSQTGVFVGLSGNDYSLLQLGADGGLRRHDPYLNTGNALSIAANRLSYLLDLRGPSLVVDTACSSSLVAVHLACQSLWSGESALALAGGVNLILSPTATVAFSQARMMAADGRCKSFDAAADGYVRGEGCGVVVLKPLFDALSDGDHIWALIRGSAVNQDGRSNGLTAPNGPAQQAVIRRALEQAQVSPSEVSYVEAHGTGTPLGDPIEVQALAAVLQEGRAPDEPCAVGSVKTNFGHLEAAAGIASLIKVALSLHHGEIVPSLHLKRLNPHISSEKIPLVFPTSRWPWTTRAERRFAGVSSFGFGGTNAHVVLEEAPDAEPTGVGVERPLHVLALSAQNEGALKELARRYAEHLAAHPEQRPQDVCFTANAGRSHFSDRLATTAERPEQLSAQLRAFAAGEQTRWLWSGRVPGRKRLKVAFLFTGQGSQYAGMGRQLYDAHPGFRRTLEECQELLRAHLEEPLLRVMFAEAGSELAAKLDETAYTQPALFALEYALARMWREWGVEPSWVLGHSVGEYVAACVAGVFSLADGLRLMAERGRLMQALPRDGEMVAVFADEHQVAEAIAPYAAEVSLAAVNGPQNVVISGCRGAVGEALEKLRAARVHWRRLPVSRAFHSLLMEPVVEEFQRVAGAVEYHAPRVALVSNVTGRLVEGDDIRHAAYWGRHLRASVRFAQGIRTLHEEGCRAYVEIGPHPTLLALKRGVPETESESLGVASLRKGRGDWEQMLEGLGRLYVGGATVDWVGVEGSYARRKVSLPTYPFRRERYWIDTPAPAPSAETAASRPARSGSKTPAPATGRDAQENVFDWLYEVQWLPAPRDVPQPATDKEATGQAQDWLIFADRGGLGRALVDHLSSRGHSCVVVSAGDADGPAGPGHYYLDPSRPEAFGRLLDDLREQRRSAFHGIVYMWNLDLTLKEQSALADLGHARLVGCHGVLRLTQALMEDERAVSPRLWVVTCGAESLGLEAAPAAVIQSPVWGLGRVIALEHPEVWGGLIDLDPAESTGVENRRRAVSRLADALLAGGAEQIAFRSGEQYVPRLVRSRARETRPVEIHAEGVYLISGGLGALGLTLARWLVERGARRLLLVSRSGLPERTTWAAPPPQTDALTLQRMAAVRALEELGASVRVVRAGSSDPVGMAEALDELRRAGDELRGVIHAAGMLTPMTVRELTREAVETVMLPKVEGAWLLHQLTRAAPLDFFLCISSVASVWGGAGLAHYAAANHFLDALAHYRQALGLRTVTINWGPWQETGVESAIAAALRRKWREQKGVSAQETAGSVETYQSALAQMGLHGLEPEQNLRALEYILGAGLTQTVVSRVDWARFKPIYEAKRERPLLDLIETQPRAEVSRPSQMTVELLRTLREGLLSERQEALEAYLLRAISRVLRFGEDELKAEHDLLALGMDSLMMMEVINELKRDLQINLYPREFFERPSVRALASYLLTELDRVRGDQAAAASLPNFYPQTLTTRPARDATVRSDSVRPLPPAVFVLSSPRSGSTLLRVMMAGHPALFCPPELHLLPFDDMRERSKALGPSHLGEGLQRALAELQALSVEASRAQVEGFAERAAPIRDIYRLLQEQAGTRLLVDKSPSYAWSLEILQRAEEMFAGARYIHLVRHPYAVIESFVRMRMDKISGLASADPSALAEQVWTITNRNVRDFLQTVEAERRHLVRFEELVRDPAKVMNEVSLFLRLPFDEALLKPYEGQRMTDGIHPHSLGIGDPNFLRHKEIEPALAEVWRSITLPRLLGEAAREIASEFGYELPRENSSAGIVADTFEEGRL